MAFLQLFITTAEKCSPTAEASDEHCSQRASECSSSGNDICFDGYSTSIITKYSDRILLTESDTKAHSSRRKEKQKLSSDAKCKEKFDYSTEWTGPPPWDPSVGGDGYPKFLCDVMVTVFLISLSSTRVWILLVSSNTIV